MLITRTAKRVVTVALCLMGLGFMTVVNALDVSECLQERPVINQFEHYDEFIVEIIRYKKLERSCRQIRDQIEALEAREREIANTPQHPELVIVDKKTGLENLNLAIAKARTYTRPVITEPIQYNRTTSQSFAFPKMKGSDMSQASIDGAIDPGSELVDQFAMSVHTEEANPPEEKIQDHEGNVNDGIETDIAYNDKSAMLHALSDQNHIYAPDGTVIKMRADGAKDHIIVHTIRIGDGPIINNYTTESKPFSVKFYEQAGIKEGKIFNYER